MVRADSEFAGLSLPVGPFLRPSLRTLLAAIAVTGLALGELEQASQSVEGDLENVRGEIDLSEDRIETIRSEIEALDGDATQLGAELIAAGQRVDLADEDIRLIEERLEALFASEQSVRARLDGHDRSISNLLASLQRISAQPSPAIIVDPSDAVGPSRDAARRCIASAAGTGRNGNREPK